MNLQEVQGYQEGRKDHWNQQHPFNKQLMISHDAF